MFFRMIHLDRRQNLRRYDGEWHKEKEDGKGVLESAAGEKLQGFWKRGKIRQDCDGKISYEEFSKVMMQDGQ